MVATKTILALAAALAGTSSALGINCRGSALCSGNKGILSQAQGQLRGMNQNQQFSDGQHITCVKSSVTIGNPSLCIFYQKTGGRRWTVAHTVRYVQQLLDHGCGACGSVPTNPGNNVDYGELTANMVTNAAARRGLDLADRVAKPRERKREAEPQPVSQAEDSAAILARALGINCRGSSTCGVGGIGHSPAGTLEQVRNAVAGGPNGSWGNGQQIACVPHVTGRLCAFYQNIGNRMFSKQQSVAYLDQLMAHGCRVCGSIPTDPGNNVGNGELTVNFVS
ncbi:Killer toxin, Kp4/SMK-like, core [Metarhizium album ARSEF 1941]|uniref:Killer toxin, Kp4/SMK-like, core n=1 Tax=Metarhizium album (strain ARSEF 1941) TaxID=1081103 RepID=A0A0B2X5J1_METAS|nr:Killer toxin, Kp4/SMK-like, core [Metarhizium album ARSEF 1941]KHO00715.1 Killer toxin, Kp4/SMK-like, core [Metarhizium album ARSEF 1941]